MICIPTIVDDDPRFLETVNHIAAKCVQASLPADLFVIRIDHWFSDKWFAFSGKTLGVAGVHTLAGLTIPPFIPNRVISQNVFSFDAELAEYHPCEARPLHVAQPSGENLKRYLRRVSQSGTFIWFSGDSAKSEHACLMVYHTKEQIQHGWYASFQCDKDWRLHKVLGLSRTELRNMMAPMPDQSAA
ncbi:MAG: hypothetical protein WC058_11480 [Phycisphaeraceae bacterium]